MNLMNIYEKLLEAIPPNQLALDEPMSHHTTFKIGGPCDLLIQPATEAQLVHALKLLKECQIPHFVMGNGSNLLVRDGGIRGAVLKLDSYFNHITVDGECIIAQSGAKLSKLVATAHQSHLIGLEFAAGIPGNLGGGIYMNAGAYGGELAQVVSQVTVLDESLQQIHLPAQEMAFGYRTSLLHQKPYIVLSAQLSLQSADDKQLAQAQAYAKELNSRRLEKQPLQYPSAGSTFKRPAGYYAGALIEQSGLKGYAIGDAQVSEKHAGFIINRGNATAKEVQALISHVIHTVKQKQGVALCPEVKIIGEN